MLNYTAVRHRTQHCLQSSSGNDKSRDSDTGFLNQVEYHENLWQIGGKPPRILNLGTRWKQVVSLMFWPLYPTGNSFLYALYSSMVL
jgi:hypothetical protein